MPIIVYATVELKPDQNWAEPPIATPLSDVARAVAEAVHDRFEQMKLAESAMIHIDTPDGNRTQYPYVGYRSMMDWRLEEGPSEP